MLFKPLTLDEITGVVELLVKELKECLVPQGIKLEVGKETEEFIAREGYDPVYGARPLKRFIQRHLETPLARSIVAGEVSDGSKVEILVKDGSMSMHFMAT